MVKWFGLGLSQVVADSDSDSIMHLCHCHINKIQWIDIVLALHCGYINAMCNTSWIREIGKQDSNSNLIVNANAPSSDHMLCTTIIYS